MNTALSLPSETVAKAHINGLRRPQGVDLHLAAEKIRGLEISPLERARKILRSALQDGGITGHHAQNIQRARMQAASKMREVTEAAHRIPLLVGRMAQDIQKSRVQAASRMSHLAEVANRVPFWGSNVARDMQQVRIQAASGISQFATSTHLAQMGMNQMTQMVQEAQKRVATEMNQVVTSAHVAQIRASQITQALASRMSQLTEAVHRAPFWASSIVQDIQQARMQVAPAISQFANSAHMAQMRVSQIERLIQRVVQHHPELATAAPGGGRRQSVSNNSSVISPELEWYIHYLVYSVPSMTWEWVRDNPYRAFMLFLGLANLYLGLVNYLDSPPADKKGFENTGWMNDSEKAVTPAQVELRSKPDSNALIRDTLYLNDDIRKIDEDGPWSEIKYWDSRNGKTKRGWVLTRHLE